MCLNSPGTISLELGSLSSLTELDLNSNNLERMKPVLFRQASTTSTCARVAPLPNMSMSFELFSSKRSQDPIGPPPAVMQNKTTSNKYVFPTYLEYIYCLSVCIAPTDERVGGILGSACQNMCLDRSFTPLQGVSQTSWETPRRWRYLTYPTTNFPVGGRPPCVVPFFRLSGEPCWLAYNRRCHPDCPRRQTNESEPARWVLTLAT